MAGCLKTRGVDCIVTSAIKRLAIYVIQPITVFCLSFCVIAETKVPLLYLMILT